MRYRLVSIESEHSQRFSVKQKKMESLLLAPFLRIPLLQVREFSAFNHLYIDRLVDFLTGNERAHIYFGNANTLDYDVLFGLTEEFTGAAS